MSEKLLLLSRLGFESVAPAADQRNLDSMKPADFINGFVRVTTAGYPNRRYMWNMSEAEKQNQSPTTIGVAVTPTRRRGRPAKKQEAFMTGEELPTPDTFAMDTDAIRTTSENPKSFSSALDTTSPGSPSTVWIETPIRYLDEGLLPLTEVELQELSPDILQRLTAWSAARSETIQDSINAIVQFMVDEDDDRAGYPLKDAIEFYVVNYV